MSAIKKNAYSEFVMMCRIDVTNEERSGRGSEFNLTDYKRIVKKYNSMITRELECGLRICGSFEYIKDFCRKQKYLIGNFFFREISPIYIGGVHIAEFNDIGYDSWVLYPMLFNCIISMHPKRQHIDTLLGIIASPGGKYKTWHSNVLSNAFGIDNRYYNTGIALLTREIPNNLIYHIISYWEKFHYNLAFPLMKMYISKCTDDNDLLKFYDKWGGCNLLELSYNKRIASGDFRLLHNRSVHTKRPIKQKSFDIRHHIYKEFWVLVQGIQSQFDQISGYEKRVAYEIIKHLL